MDSGSREKLLAISTYAWDDSGSHAAEYFQWISHDAASPDEPTATAAGESAHEMASFLADDQGALASIGYGFLGLRHSSVGALNPQLVGAYGQALTRFQGAMVGAGEKVPGFAPLKGVDVDDYSSVVNVFAVIASDPDAGKQFIASGYGRVDDTVRSIATTGCVDPAAARASEPALVRVGALAGSIAAAVERPGAAKLPVKGLDEANNKSTFIIADECLARAPASAPQYLRPYMDGASLLRPEQVSEQMGAAALVKYYSALESYIREREFELTAFSKGFHESAQ
ncbi:hypothetical protein [Mycobacterium sp. RTGN4]|nr:hypothetical protein [Mycobacterium sp. RTGN4]